MEDVSQQSKDVLGIYGSCRSCQVGKSCLLKGISKKNIELFENIIERKLFLKKGALLFSQGASFRSIYIVQSGALKAYGSKLESFKHNSSLINSDEQITEIFFPGDLIGLSAITNGTHPNTVRALETATVCELSYESIQSLSQRLPELQHNLFRAFSKELHKIQHQRNCLRQRSAESRYAIYLLSVYDRYKQLGNISSKIQLCMSRYDVCNYLNLAQETISRISCRFQRDGIINIENETINLNQLESLEKIAGPNWQRFKMIQQRKEMNIF